MITEPTVEELLERMTELHGEEWLLKVTGDRVTLEWEWEDDGDLENETGEGCTFTASLRFISGTTLRHTLEIATRGWEPITLYGTTGRHGWCCRLCGYEHLPNLTHEMQARSQGAHHLFRDCPGRAPTTTPDAS